MAPLNNITSAPRDEVAINLTAPAGRARTPSPPGSAKASSPLVRPSEQFPNLFPPAKGAKSKSLTEAEIQVDVMHPSEIAAIGERLKTEVAPMSLDQVRQRRASIKEERKRSIDFIRSRTSSRAAANGRPTMDMLQGGVPARTSSASSVASGSSVGPGGFGEGRTLEKLEESNKD
ncbi:hypothetical protein EG329_000522 [Mollisiaceae sp. DMI_Dod_QoI]|nr:hypothetical protein EG329_000522 [Helotiales sp. DMI_Dod_QoI]